MKKPICFILSMLLLFTACSKKLQNEPDVTDEPELPKEIDSLAAALWDYPIKRGTEEWYRLTPQERIEALQVPEEVLEKITTEKLVELVITFPSYINFAAWESPQRGFEALVERYNIFEPLLLSKDAGKYLLAAYKDAGMTGFRTLPYSNGGWTNQLDYLELLLAQKEILQSLTPEEKFELLLEARQKFSEKIDNESFASLPGVASTLRIMIRILYIEEYPDLAASSNIQTTIRFIESGSFMDAPPFDEIIIITDNYINEKNKIS